MEQYFHQKFQEMKKDNPVAMLIFNMMKKRVH